MTHTRTPNVGADVAARLIELQNEMRVLRETLELAGLDAQVVAVYSRPGFAGYRSRFEEQTLADEISQALDAINAGQSLGPKASARERTVWRLALRERGACG